MALLLLGLPFGARSLQPRAFRPKMASALCSSTRVAATGEDFGPGGDLQPLQRARKAKKDRRDPEARAARKERKKAAKEAKRDKKGVAKTKPCTLCGGEKDLLIRCMVDESRRWEMVCGKCWRDVSGGVTDGDADHPHYRYGGLWRARK